MAALLPAGRISVSGRAVGADGPWGDLVAEFCGVIVAIRPHADVELIGHAAMSQRGAIRVRHA